MSKTKKVLLFFLIAALLTGIIPTAPEALPEPTADNAAAPISPPASLSASAAVLMEAESGRLLYTKNADTPLPMASTTKIMTALVALECASPDRVITVAPEAVGVEGSSVYLTEGEKLTLEDLLYALLLESANDAATAIAIGLFQTTDAFAEQMNRKAAELGLTNTHFTNPHGLDHPDHCTTARELAVIAQAALKNQTFRTIVSTRKKTIPHSGEDGVRLLVNHNKLLRTYEGCIGVKTGYTKSSGRCLVSAAERDGVTLIAVTIRDPDDWREHSALLDYGFSLCRSVTLAGKGTIAVSLPVVGGTTESITLTNREDCAVTLPRSAGTIRAVLEYRRFEYAPVSKDETLGEAVFYADCDGDGNCEVIARAPLLADTAVEKKTTQKGFFAWLRALFSGG